MTQQSSYWQKIAIVLLLAACAFFVYSRFANKPEIKAPSSGTTAISAKDPDQKVANIPKSETAPAKQIAAAPSAAAYNSSANLRSLLDSLQGDSSKKRDYDLVKAKAFEECFIFTRQPNYANDVVQSRKAMNKGSPDVLQKFADTLTQRCRDVANSGPISLKESKSLYAEAAKEGSPEAMAHQLRSTLVLGQDKTSIDDLRSKSIDLINTGDPAAIFELSGAFGSNSKFSGAAVGSEKATAAWQLVACDMGLDCSANSALIAGACLNGGMYCEPGDLRYNMQQGQFSPSDYEEVLALETAIYSQITNGKTAMLFR